MQRPQISSLELDAGFNDLNDAVAAKIAKHGYGIYLSNHESLGIIAEEYHELLSAVQSNNVADIRAELMDVAVGALFAVISLDVREAEKAHANT